MRLVEGAVIMGLKIEVRPALIAAERIWKEHGRSEGFTITCGLDGEHSAGSLHPYGYAIDIRTKYFTEEVKKEVFAQLKKELPEPFDVIWHSTHIHIEFDVFRDQSLYSSLLRWLQTEPKPKL